MENIKRIYLTLVEGLSILIHPKAELQRAEDSATASNRVSRKVDYYRAHFFNL